VSFSAALETGDVALLPSRRDEDWRWTDLRGLLRALPPKAGHSSAALGEGPFAGLADETLGGSGWGGKDPRPTHHLSGRNDPECVGDN
jgi:Fe-S cluster assembly protein SufD